MQTHKNVDAYTVEFAEGWQVHVDTVKNNYTGSRDSRSVAFNDLARLPKCHINYSLTMRRGEDQISIPAHVLDFISEHTHTMYSPSNPFGPLEKKLTKQCLKRVGGRDNHPKPKRRVPIKTLLCEESAAGPKHTVPAKRGLSENLSTVACVEIAASDEKR